MDDLPVDDIMMQLRGLQAQGSEVVEYYMRVLLDAFHLLQRYQRRLGSKVDPASRMFMVMMRDALFINDKKDEEQVTAYLKARGMSEEEIKRVGHTFFVRHCRRAIPPPQQLAARLQAVYDIFDGVKMSNGKDLYRGREGLQSSMAEEHRAIMRHVLLGCVADHPDVPLYCEKKPTEDQAADSLPDHLCFRGSSQLEGFHRHLLTAVKTWCLAPEMMDAVILEFVISWNSRAQRVNKLQDIPSHTDYLLLDTIVTKEMLIWGRPLNYPNYIKTIEVICPALPSPALPYPCPTGVPDLPHCLVQITDDHLESFGCGRTLGSDTHLRQPAAQAQQEDVVSLLENEEEPQHDQEDTVAANGDNTWEAALLIPDEEEVEQLLNEASPPVARPYHLKTARESAGKRSGWRALNIYIWTYIILTVDRNAQVPG